jgi:hypothetical protein
MKALPIKYKAGQAGEVKLPARSEYVNIFIAYLHYFITAKHRTL